MLVNNICRAISAADLFICDLTYLNPNVLFELGFAIAQRRKIWVTLNRSFREAPAAYGRTTYLSTLGYVPYRNSSEVVEAFHRERPHQTSQSVYDATIEQVLSSRDQVTGSRDIRGLLYLPAAANTEASVRLTRAVEHSKLPYIVDDPAEISANTLTWYARHTHNSYGLIAHFLSPEHEGFHSHNNKLSFAAGLAYGFNRKVLLLAHGPYSSAPFDYRDMLRVHKTAEECEAVAKNWLGDQQEPFLEELTVTRRKRTFGSTKGLHRVSLGEFISENEPEDLAEYFVETAAFSEALVARHAVVVGRKGSGKTAMFLMLRETLSQDKRVHLCAIKPVSYELQGLVRLLEHVAEFSERSYLFESLWKFLIYSELVASVHAILTSRPSFVGFQEGEQVFMDFVEKHASIFLTPFSIRLDNAVRNLLHVPHGETPANQRVRVSELLHEQLLADARSQLGKILSSSERVVVLIDNLDKAWERGPTLDLLGEALFRLLSVSQSITRDFDRQDHWRERVNLSLILFLRSDIFNYVYRSAREPDKIVPKRLQWRDPAVLLRVIEERFLRSSTSITEPNEVWERYFDNIGRIPARIYLSDSVLPRPRDIIYLAKEALANAINRRHDRIQGEDLEDAVLRYSQFAFESLVVEASSRVPRVEELLLEFVGGPRVVTRDDIVRYAGLANIDSQMVDEYIGVLKNLSFLGLEVDLGRYEYISDFDDLEREKATALARRLQGNGGSPTRYEVNRAFWRFLELKP